MTAFSPVLDGLRPVFVVGHPRSGTTLVQQLLSAHPAFWSAPETHLFTDVFAKVDNWQGRPLQPDELTLVLTRLSRKPRIVLPDTVAAALAADAARGILSPARLLDTIMRALKPQESMATRWLEKTPRHVYLLGPILGMFPDARVIHVLRDPRGVASSPVRFGQLEPGPERSALVAERGQSWNDLVDLIEGMSAEPRLMTIRYEDIMADREAALERLTQHVGVDFDPGVFERFGSTYSQVTVASENVRKQLNATGEIVDRRAVYRKRMTTDEIALIDTICRERMLQHGYTPDGEPRPDLVGSIVAWAAARPPKGKRARPANTGSTAVRRMRAAGRRVRQQLGGKQGSTGTPAAGRSLRTRLKSLLRPLWRLYLRAERRFRPLRRLRRRFANPQMDVFFVSFPKSGRTWVRFVLGRAIQLHHGITPERKRVLTSTLYAAATGRTMKISHDMTTREDAGYSGMNKRKYAGQRVFLLTRDIRDTLVSYYHHRFDRRHEIDMTLSEYVRSDVYGARKIALFYRSWHESRHLPKELLRIRYEDMRNEPFPKMRQIADFLLLGHIGDDVLRTACEEGDFANMRRLEMNKEILQLRKAGDAAMPENASRVRKGKVGGHRDELTEGDIAYIDEVVREVGVPQSWVYYDAES